MSEAPQAQRHSAVEDGALRPLPVTPLSQPLHLTVHHLGGPEDGWYVVCKGKKSRYPGWICLSDLMADLHNGGR